MRRQIEHAAFAMILSKGAKLMTMRELAKAAHMSTANLYQYFDSRDEILLLIFEQSVVALQTFVQQVDQSLPSREYLIAICLAYWDFAHTAQEQMLVMNETARATRHLRSTPPGDDTIDLSSVSGIFQLAVARCLQEKSIIPANHLSAQEIAHTLLQLLNGRAIMPLPNPGLISRQVMHSLIENFLDGLMTTAAKS